MRVSVGTLAVVALIGCAGEALAHGGYYGPPPYRGPRGPRGPRTPGTPPPKIPGAVTPSGSEMVPADPGDWTRWWFANRRLLLPAIVHDPATRDTTTAAEGAWRERARTALRAALVDPDDDVASASAVALGKLRDVPSAPALASMLEDRKRDRTVREAAALGLGLVGLLDGEDRLRAREALQDVAGARREDARLRAIVIYALALRGHAYTKAAGDTSDATASVQSAALSAMGLGGPGPAPDHRTELEQLLAKKGDRHRGVRVYAAHALARLGTADSVPQLCTAAGHEDANTRRAAALALGVVGRGDAKAATVLGAMLRDDPDRSCRGAAAIGIGRIAAPGARETLAAALGGDPVTGSYAALGLGLLSVAEGDPGIGAPLLETLRRDGDASLRGAAAAGIALARPPGAGPVLLEIVQRRGDVRLRAHAAFALGRVGEGVETSQSLRELLIEREHPWLPRESALALGELRDRSASRVLRRLLEDGPSLYVQAAAALALGSIGGDPAGGALVDLLGDTSKPALSRAMAAVALGRLLDRGGEARLALIGADLDWHLFTPAVDEILTIL